MALIQSRLMGRVLMHKTTLTDGDSIVSARTCSMRVCFPRQERAPLEVTLLTITQEMSLGRDLLLTQSALAIHFTLPMDATKLKSHSWEPLPLSLVVQLISTF
jgi:hypothetical protein